MTGLWRQRPDLDNRLLPGFFRGLRAFAWCLWFGAGVPALIILAGWGLYVLVGQQ